MKPLHTKKIVRNFFARDVDLFFYFNFRAIKVVVQHLQLKTKKLTKKVVKKSILDPTTNLMRKVNTHNSTEKKKILNYDVMEKYINIKRKTNNKHILILSVEIHLDQKIRAE